MRKTIKKVTVLLMILVLTLTFVELPANAALKGYYFTHNRTSITMNSRASTFIKKAGKPKSKKVSKSCAYNGKDRVYKYNNFILYTYSKTKNGPEYVNGITFLNKKAKTKEGIGIGSSLKKVKATYGRGTEKYGIYTYKKGKTKLQIEITNNKVSNLRYIMIK